MEAFSKTLKGFVKSFVPSQNPQSSQGTLVLDNQRHDHSSWIIPPSPTLQRLADETLQAEARKCLKLLGEEPTDEQWKMILAPTSSTCVGAGAGSGKSTTLVLRLLILHKLLGIPLEAMHVFSFTRDSINDFQQKLQNKLIRWEEVIEPGVITEQRRSEIQALAKRTVTTFHSVLWNLCRDVMPGVDPSSSIFDMLDTKKSEDDDDGIRSYNPFVSADLSDKQSEILTRAHQRAYRDSERYQELMLELRKAQDQQFWLRRADVPNREDHLKRGIWIRLHEQELTYHGYSRDRRYRPQPDYRDQQRTSYVDPYRVAVADRLIELGIPFIPLVRFPISCPIPRANDGELQASFQIGNQLLLHVERYSRKSPLRNEEERKLAFHERDRGRFIALYSRNTDRHKVLRPDDFDTSGEFPCLTPDADLRLRQWVGLSSNALPMADAPAMLIRLPGDIHDVHIAELLYREGAFIESMGLEVEQFQTQGRTLDPTSRAIAEALPIFWHAFREVLQEEGYIRFHDILTQLRNVQTLRSLRDRLQHLRHQFIDEFQDSSPELVDWLSKTLQVLIESSTEVSVIAIGDDYQSIYGWRGSHPIFLMHFEQYFPSAQVGKITLTKNFRSRQPIIDAAEAVLEPVRRKMNKHGESALQASEDGRLDPVRLVEVPLSWRMYSAKADLWSTFCSYVSGVLHDLQMSGNLAQLIGGRRELSVYILSRTRETLGRVPNRRSLAARLSDALRHQGITQFPKTGISVRAMTFHQSKGLEADVVLLLDDSRLPDEHPLREWVFSQTRFLGQDAGTYTQTMTDEARRLAYVALTRARLAVMWVPLTDRQAENDGQLGTNGANQTNATVSAQGCFVVVKNSLQANGRMH
jgi:superfamily I DNA/RNA helicase